MKEETNLAHINRRNFVASVGLLGLVGLSPIKSSGAERPAPELPDQDVLKAGPYLQTLRPDSIVVRWITNVPCASWVEYGESAEKLDQRADVSAYGLFQANNKVHAIPITGLAGGKVCYYRICSKEIKWFGGNRVDYGQTYVSKSFAFSTPAPGAESVSFLVFNDIHDRPESFAHLMQFAGSEKKDFVFLNGDMFNKQEDEDQLVNHLLKPVSGLFSPTTPFVFSRGNHETRGGFSRRLADYFDGNEQKFHFSFKYGPAYVIVLDSGEDKEDNHAEYSGLANFDSYRIQQARWLEKEVQKRDFRKAKYKIVFSHIPLYYSGDWHGTMHCRELWGPILNKAKIDLLISGHTHRYGVHHKVEGQHNYPIVIGGGPQDGRRTIIKVHADQKSLKLDMIDDKGKLVGNVMI